MPATVRSLVQPNSSSAEDRALVYEAAADNGAPTSADQGVRTQGKRFLHIATDLNAGTAKWSLYVWCDMSETWNLDTALGTNGVVTLASPGKTWNVREILGVERIYVRAFDQAGMGKLSIWAGSVGGYGSADG